MKGTVTSTTDTVYNIVCFSDRAVRAGVCGAPSFQVDQGQVIWGQDRLNIVADLMCGWQYPPTTANTNSKL